MTASSSWSSASLWAGSLGTSDVGGAPPNRSVDVVVVGAGLAGLLTAWTLVDAGLDVVVVERHHAGGVTTRGSTGKLTALQGGRYSAIAEQRDEAAARLYAEASLFGVGALHDLIDTLAIDCSLTEATDHVFAATRDGLDRCRAEHDAAAAAGLPVTWTDDLDLPVPTLGAVTLPEQAHLDPGALGAGLADRLGDRVVENTPALDVEERADGVTVRLEGDAAIDAQHVVVATLGPFHDPAMLATRCTPSRSYVVACPHPDPPTGTYISLDPEARSIRPAALATGSGVVIAGEGHTLGLPEDQSAAERWDSLARYAATLGAGAPTHQWTAHDLVPSDGVPFIGRSASTRDRTWVASGFQKWGISTAMVAADLIAAGIQGEERPWTELFDPTRLADSATKRLAQDAVRAVQHLVVEPVKGILAGGDPAPRCTHLGCALSWDEAEATWDCPCHGSRFTESGEVICGPAAAPLDLPSRS